MLTHLVVKDVALVDLLELEFEDGMSVITGETGAGKSIMLDALGLALGDRADAGLIAPNADKAEIHATFDISGNDAAQSWLREREIDAESGECLLRRIISHDGRSRGFINGIPTTVSDLKSIGEMLLDIHSQHEHQSLLKKDTHRRLLDEFGGHDSASQTVAELTAQFRQKRAALDELIATNTEQTSRLQLLSYQAEELDALGAATGESQTLEAEQKLLANAEQILRACNEAIEICSESEAGNALSLISKAIHLLSEIELPQVTAIVNLLESGRIQLEEAAHDISHFSDSVEIDQGRLTEVEDRLSALYDVARKHRIEPDEIPALHERIKSELTRLGNVDVEIDRLTTEVVAVKAEYTKAAGVLTRARTKAAKQLNRRVSGQLSNLGMQGAAFDIALSPRENGDPHPDGAEDIEFLISTNPGQAPRALNRIASGGELSRISLAIQVVTADTSRVPTLVFDEVDVGIGGAIAEVVGSLLRALGTKAQIICVTHLPQVAAQGHQHFRVTKTSDKKSAKTEITQLEAADKVEEIARMLGGLEVTRQSLAHAEEMYAAGQR